VVRATEHDVERARTGQNENCCMLVDERDVTREALVIACEKRDDRLHTGKPERPLGHPPP
jgi:hypothetical protein